LLILNHLQFISLIFTFRCFCLNCALFPTYVCLVAARTWYRHIYRSASAQP